jgi:hypothetical protein
VVLALDERGDPVTGGELTTVWLFGILCSGVTVALVFKSLAESRVEVAKQYASASVEANRVVAEVRGGAVYPPADWAQRDGGA